MNTPDSSSDSGNIPPPSIDLRERDTESIRESEISDRAQFLLNLWISQKTIDTIKKYVPTLYHKERVQATLQALRLLGFSDPVKMIEKSPAILGLKTEQNIIPKIEGMRALGFSDPMKMIEKYPQILCISTETSIIPKIEGIRALGFSDPVKMIEKYPSILSRNLEGNIAPKIEGIRALGFSDPVKMIEKYPSILWPNIEENIVPKMRLLDRMIPDTKIWREMIENMPSLIGNQYNRYWILLRWLYTLGMLDADIIPRFPRMNTYEIETFVLTVEELRSDTAFLSLPTHEKARQLDSRYRSLKKHGNKASRREKILALISDTNKLVRRYGRAYPEKK